MEDLFLISINDALNSYLSNKWKTLDANILSKVDGIVIYLWDEEEKGKRLIAVIAGSCAVLRLGFDI